MKYAKEQLKSWISHGLRCSLSLQYLTMRTGGCLKQKCEGDHVLLSPFSAVNSVKGGSAFSCVDMTENGLYYIPQVKSLASCLSPRLTLSTSGLTLPLIKCAVQLAWRALSIMKTQEHTRWLKLSNPPDKQKHDFLYESEDRNRLFHPAVAKMQKRCEKIGGEALQKLCLPRKRQAAPAPCQGGPSVQNADTHGCASFYVPQGTGSTQST